MIHAYKHLYEFLVNLKFRIFLKISRFLLFSLTAILLLTQSIPSANSQIAAPPAKITLGAFFEGLKSVIAQLEASARTLIEQGNNALAQQQMMLAGILRGTIEQSKLAYADSLNLTFEQLNVAEQNTFNDLLSAINKTSDIEKQTSEDAQAAIYKVQGAANQVLNKLPLITKTPVFYGIKVRDLTTNPKSDPSDIEVLGFLFSDSRLDFKKPEVSIGGVTVDPQMVSVQEDRLQVQLPEEIKRSIGFGNSPCSPRKTFPVLLKVYYGKAKGFWPIRWTSETSIDFNANALPGAELFEVQVVYDAVRTTNSLRTEKFSTTSGVVSVGCEESGNTVNSFQSPANATELNCNSGWVNGSNLKAQSQNCAIGGNIVTATGTITGLDRQCFLVLEALGWIVGRKNVCNCPGGGSGQLQISGTYKVPESKVESLSNVAVDPYVTPEGKSLFITLPTDTSVKKTIVRAVIKRKGCAAEFDSVIINLPKNENLGLTQTSSKGHYNVSFRNDQLIISNAK